MAGRNSKWRSAYVEHDPVEFVPVGESMTRREFAAECDINTLMKRYAQTGVISHVNNTQPRYLDLADTPDFMTALNMMNDAQAAFMRLPSVVRREFDNNPAEFIEYALKEENLPKLREWGLAPPEKAPEAPTRVEIVNPQPPAGGVPEAP